MHPLMQVPFTFVYLIYCILEAVIRVFIPKQTKSVAGKIVLVTGAGHGIGREFAIQFSRLGARLVLLDVNKSNNDAVADEITRNGGSATAYVCDVSKSDAVKDIGDRIHREVGDVEILVNNAGVLNGGELLKLQEKDIRRTMEINTIAHFWTLRAFLPPMMVQNEGHVITIASMAARAGTAYLVDYCASKFGAYGMTEAIRAEMRLLGKDGIKFTTVCPLFVDTGMTKTIRGKTKWLTPMEVVSEAIVAMQRDEEVVTIPRALDMAMKIRAFLPVKFRQFLDATFPIGIGPQYEPKRD